MKFPPRQQLARPPASLLPAPAGQMHHRDAFGAAPPLLLAAFAALLLAVPAFAQQSLRVPDEIDRFKRVLEDVGVIPAPDPGEAPAPTAPTAPRPVAGETVPPAVPAPRAPAPVVLAAPPPPSASAPALPGDFLPPGEGTPALADSGPLPSRPSPAATASGGAGGTPGVGAVEASGCPRALLRGELSAAAEGDDVIIALAVETELLRLCRERQNAVAALVEGESRLRELVADAVKEDAADAPAPPPAPDILAQLLPPEPEPARPASVVAPATRRAPTFGWFDISGAAGDLRAGVTDGRTRYYVREGDELPGGVRVARISGRPPAVEVSGAELPALPFRLPPGAGR